MDSIEVAVYETKITGLVQEVQRMERQCDAALALADEWEATGERLHGTPAAQTWLLVSARLRATLASCVMSELEALMAAIDKRVSTDPDNRWTTTLGVDVPEASASRSAAPMSQLISIEAAAELLGCSSKTIRRRISDGQLAAFRMGKRAIRVRRDDVMALLTPIPTLGEKP